MTVKKAIGKIHLWLGLSAGAVIIVSMLAAAVFVWERELTDWYYRKKVFVSEAKATPLPIPQLLEAARKAFPDRPLTSIHISRDPGRSYYFANYKRSATPGWTWVSEVEYFEQVYVNQYTGEVLGRIDMRYDWIFMSRMLHQCLLLRYDVGHWVIATATLILLAMVVTGLVLWWPRNRAARKQRFSIKWGARWRRVNYDVHNVGGFYTHLLILILASSGLVWSFTWWANGIYRMLGTDPEKVWEQHKPLVVTGPKDSIPYETILNSSIAKRKSWEDITIVIPTKEERDKELRVNVKFNDHGGWDEWDTYFYHPGTGGLHAAILQENKTLGAKWRNSNYAIHVGSIYGLPTKLLACFAALFCASLPVTGFLIWRGRRKKTQKKNPIHVRTHSALRLFTGLAIAALMA